jgi:hypothetical protein
MHPSYAAAALFIASALLAPALPIACSSGPPSAATACNDYERAACQNLAQCDSVEMEIEFAGSVDSCVASFGPQCATAFTINGTGVTPSTLEACASATSDEACADYLGQVSPAACALPPGTLANGVPCFEDAQCQGGECNFGTTTGVPAESDAGAACGTCTQKPSSPPATGCEAAGCPHGQACVTSVTPTGGETSACVTAVAQGTPCGTSAPCQSGLVCGSTTEAEPTCQPPPVAGQPCLGATCANGLLCGNDGNCAAPQFISLGGSCSLLSAPDAGVQICAGGDCVGGVCVAYAALGASCGLFGDPTCAPGLSCASGRCASDETPIPAACN